MNIEKNLIFIKGEDKTAKVEYCRYNSSTKKYDVTFLGGAIFSYNYNNIVWIRDAKDINIDNKVVYVKDKPVVTIKKVISFGDYIRVIHTNGYNEL